jgi:hypothetical protein
MKRIIAALTLACALLWARPASAVINFPATLDDNTTLFQVNTEDVITNTHHNNLKDAVVALETKVGVDSSGVTTTLEYLLKNSLSVDPGHKHTGASVTFADGSAASPGVRFGNPITDTNTGIFHPGTGLVAFSSSGAEIIRVSTLGLGIFDTAGDFPLDVNGTVRIQSAFDLCFGGTGAVDNDTCLDRDAAHVLRLIGNLKLVDAATTDNSLVIQGIAAKTGEFVRLFFLPADANPFFQITEAGVLEFGAGGGSAPDTNLFRSAANTLRTDDSFIIGTNLQVLGATVTLAEGTDVVLGTATGTRFGTATNQRIGFYNAAPVVQPTASTALITIFQNLGLIASGTYSGNIVTTGSVTIGTSGIAITRHLSNSATLDFANVAAGPECSADLTITVTNAAAGDRCDLGVPSGVPAKSMFMCFVSASNTVTVRHCCLTGACDPASATYRAGVWQ